MAVAWPGLRILAAYALGLASSAASATSAAAGAASALADRGQKLSSLNERVEQLVGQAANFEQAARELRGKQGGRSWWDM